MSWFSRSPKEAIAAAKGSLEIRRPWARSNSEKELVAAGFMTITNHGSVADRLVAATSPAVETIEIHAIKVVGPNLRMKRVEDGLPIPPEYTMTLKPRGYHLLLLGLKAPLAVGARLPVTLTFRETGAIDIELVVEAPGAVGEYALHEDRQRG